MIVYSSTVEGFRNDVEHNNLTDKIHKKMLDALNLNVGKSQIRAWDNSLDAMYKVLAPGQVASTAGVAIEYNIPMTAKRVDFMLSGYDVDQKANVVIVELKQWETAEAVPGTDALVETFLGKGMHRTVHPSYQAWSYAALLKDFNEYVEHNDVSLSPCAYLHNWKRASDDPLLAPQYDEYLRIAPPFGKHDVDDLRTFIRHRVHEGDDGQLLRTIEDSKARPSKKLQDCIVKMLEGNPEFVLVDEQMVAYESILQWSRKCKQDGKKRTIIVEGGPGTGKSVVAVNLLAALTGNEQLVQYVSRSAAPRDVYLSKLTRDHTLQERRSIASLFTGSGKFVDADSNSLDTLIVDEAHRLNEHSGMYKNFGENQVKEVINASKCSVFFLDEKQRVTINDIGSKTEIEKWADAQGSKVHHLTLPSQFRCNGSDGYIAWLDNVLQIRETANYTLDDAHYDFRVVDSPEELRRLIEEKDAQDANPSRLVAGYCWEWPKAGRNDTDAHDIIIDDFEISWNLGNSKTYAIDEASVREAGCIHTVQGLEFAYVGVIIGDDMRYKEGEVCVNGRRYDTGIIVTDFWKRAKSDQSLKGIKKLNKEDPEKAYNVADEIIKNTYRTLMTRGMKGCFVYCTDPALGKYLREHAYSHEHGQH